MFYSLVLSICAGINAAVGEPCQEWVIDQLPTLKACLIEQDKRIKAGNILFKGNQDWIISCERTIVLDK